MKLIILRRLVCLLFVLVAVCRGWSVWRRLRRPPTNGINTDTCDSGVEWQVGWCIVFPFTSTSRCLLLVGKIEEGVKAEEGDEFKGLWYTQE